MIKGDVKTKRLHRNGIAGLPARQKLHMMAFIPTKYTTQIKAVQASIELRELAFTLKLPETMSQLE